jgi:hypothetical protein
VPPYAQSIAFQIENYLIEVQPELDATDRLSLEAYAQLAGIYGSQTRPGWHAA